MHCNISLVKKSKHVVKVVIYYSLVLCFICCLSVICRAVYHGFFFFFPDMNQFLCSFPFTFLLFCPLTSFGILREWFQGKFFKRPAKCIFSIELKKKNLHSNKLGLMWSVLSQIRPAQGKGAQPVIWEAFEATCTCIY